MYGWLWRHLPGPAPVRALIALALFIGVVAVLFLWVFPWLEPRLQGLRQRRQRLLAKLAEARSRGLPARLLRQPDGAFYALLQVRTPLMGLELVERLIREHGVAALPGESFGLPATGETAVLRLSYGLLAADQLEQALERVGAGLMALAA